MTIIPPPDTDDTSTADTLPPETPLPTIGDLGSVLPEHVQRFIEGIAGAVSDRLERGFVDKLERTRIELATLSRAMREDRAAVEAAMAEFRQGVQMLEQWTHRVEKDADLTRDSIRSHGLRLAALEESRDALLERVRKLEEGREAVYGGETRSRG